MVQVKTSVQNAIRAFEPHEVFQQRRFSKRILAKKKFYRTISGGQFVDYLKCTMC